MDPALAKKVAMGDADPITLLPMEDINPTYTPKIPLKNTALNSSHQIKGKGKATPGQSASGGILQFFGTPLLQNGVASCVDIHPFSSKT